MTDYKNIPYNFCWKTYLELNSDLNQNSTEENAKNHYEDFGFFENRRYKHCHDENVFSQKNMFNPSFFECNNKFYYLLRNETDISNWEKSVMTYTLYECDKYFNIRHWNFCDFIINKNRFKSINRKKLDKNYYAIEDIKIFNEPINNKIIGVCNILIKHDQPRIFRVGLVEINVDRNEIILLKIFNKFDINIKLKNSEKNWTLYKYDNEYFFIYTLFPLVIFKFNKDTLKITNHYSNNNLHLIKNFNLSDVGVDYKHILFSPTPLVKLSHNMYVMYVKSKNNDTYYKYYKWYFIIKNNNIEIITNPEIMLEGKCLYLNDVKTIDNQLIGFLGKNDSSFEFIKLK